MFKINYFLIFEFLSLLSFFIIVAREIYRRHYRQLFEIAGCAAYGMILEIGNTHMSDTYAYGQNFLVNLANVPVVIGLDWAVVIYCVMRISDQYNIPWKLRPFMDALMAVIIDLAIDTVAIRLGLWHWRIPLDKEWYGVPFENLVGWILVVLSFSFLARYARTLDYKQLKTKLLMLFLPILSYIGLTIGLIVFSIIVTLPFLINDLSTFKELLPGQNFVILLDPQVVFYKVIFFALATVGLIGIVIASLSKYRKSFLRNFNWLEFLILTWFHVFFLVAIITTGLYHELPFLLIASLVGLLLHFFIHGLPYLINKKINFN